MRALSWGGTHRYSPRPRRVGENQYKLVKSGRTLSTPNLGRGTPALHHTRLASRGTTP